MQLACLGHTIGMRPEWLLNAWRMRVGCDRDALAIREVCNKQTTIMHGTSTDTAPAPRLRVPPPSLGVHGCGAFLATL